MALLEGKGQDFHMFIINEKKKGVYPLGDIRDYLILLGFLFDMDLEDIYSEGLNEQVAKTS